MLRSISACALGALLLSAPAAFAEEAAAPESPHSFSANVGLFSQYIFRGISQTNEDPALQGGFDYSHSSGFYIGTWASNVSWIRDAENQTGSAEIDIYGGFANEIGDTGIGYDVGLLYYWYPGKGLGNPGLPKGNTLEAYGQVSYGWFYAKYSHALSDDVFGFANARNSYYIDLGADIPLGDSGFTAGLHYGHQKIENATSYNDYKVSLAYDLGRLSSTFDNTELGLMYTKHDAGNVFTSNIFGSESQVTGYVTRSF